MRVLRQLLESVTRTTTGSDTSAGGGDSNLNYEGRDISEARGPIEIYAYVFAVSGSGGPTPFLKGTDGFEGSTKEGACSSGYGGVYRDVDVTKPHNTTATMLYRKLTVYA